MTDGSFHQIDSEETIARLVHQEWVVNGVLQQTAFILRNGEAYLSVNRPAVDTYEADVEAFVSQHPKYRTAPLNDTYRRAILNVGDVRAIDISVKGEKLDVSVEVEPRAFHTKSHAGIFTRIEGKNVKGEDDISTIEEGKKIVSTSMILQKLRWNLLQLATLETCMLMQSHGSTDQKQSAHH